MALPNQQLELPPAGVRGGSLAQFDDAGLRLIYSPLDSSADWTRNDAIQFHSVLRHLFEQAAIIPFRFATVLRDDEELRDEVRASAEHYRSSLTRLADAVQMEIKVAPAKREDAAPAGMTGAQYLRARGEERERLEATAAAARAALGRLAREWRERESGEGLRCFALVARSQTADFQRRAAALAAPEGVTVVVSGPWPATEFLAPVPPVAAGS